MQSIDEQQFVILTPAFIYVTILVLLGFPGNIVSFLVYKFQLKSTTGRDAIIMLAVCDIINCVISIPVELFIMTRYFTFGNAALCKMSRFVTYSMNNASGLILMAIAFERYRTICAPHKPKIPKARMQLVCICMVVLGPILALPALWIYGIQTDLMYENGMYVISGKDDMISLNQLDPFNVKNATESGVNESVYMVNLFTKIRLLNVTRTRRCLIDDSVRNTWFSYSFFGFLTIASASVMFILVFVYTNIALKIKGLRRLASTPGETERERSASKKKQATSILFLITLAFQFSFIPFVIITNIRFFTSPNWYNNQSMAGKMIYHFFLRSYLLNCAVNPFIYCIISPQFRSALCKLQMRLKGQNKTMVTCCCGERPA